ncbi:MAG: hypothetical protein QOD41_3112 [Cryptosporangiaceae bacterium]|jgi:hypothetical protein|nr:hypothetical protein [Cryptosporangiaceae bacterium]
MSTSEHLTPRTHAGAPEPATFLGGLPPLPAAPAIRPGSVTAAAVLLAGQAILALAGLAVSFADRDSLRATKIDFSAVANHLAGSPTDVSLFGVGCSGLLSVIFLALAAYVLRGSRPARIAALALTGAGLLSGLRILYSAPSPAKDGPDFLQVNNTVTLVMVLAMAISVAIIVLLALPRSEDYFSKRRG